MVRDAPIASFGSVDLLVRDAEGKPDRMMQADETVYLRPERVVTPEGSLVIGEHDLPDVVLEVDHTTDVRPGKLLLLLYEAWGFPELWVVVPPAGATRRKPAGVTTDRMLGGRYQSVPASVALPGWTAAEIHAGLTEPVTARTYDVLARVGRALGAREGMGPDDDPMLRALGEQTLARGLAEGRTQGLAEGRTQGLAEGRTQGLAEGHSRGVAEGRAEGLAEVRAQELAAVVRNTLEARGMSFADEVSDAVVDVPRDAAVAAAVICTDAEDFRRRLALGGVDISNLGRVRGGQRLADAATASQHDATVIVDQVGPLGHEVVARGRRVIGKGRPRLAGRHDDQRVAFLANQHLADPLELISLRDANRLTAAVGEESGGRLHG